MKRYLIINKQGAEAGIVGVVVEVHKTLGAALAACRGTIKRLLAENPTSVPVLDVVSSTFLGRKAPVSDAAEGTLWNYPTKQEQAEAEADASAKRAASKASKSAKQAASPAEPASAEPAEGSEGSEPAEGSEGSEPAEGSEGAPIDLGAALKASEGAEPASAEPAEVQPAEVQPAEVQPASAEPRKGKGKGFAAPS